jgi:endonuclease/exonuclease/phosphatase family metal-dependent hydrolase
MQQKSPIVMLILAALSSLLVLSGGGCSAKQQQPRELTVMTYNIHHAEGMDKKLDVERIARVIREQKPDLVALQEVDAGTNRTQHVMQAAQLARLTKMHYAYGPAMDYDGGKYGDAVLSRYKIVEQRVIALPYTLGDRREPRVAVMTSIELPGGKKIAFISTHLDHTAHSPDRLPQAKAIDEQLRDLKEPAILAGDFNCEPDSPPMQELAKDWTMVGNGDDATFVNDMRRIKIDHVLVKPKDRFRVIEARVIDDRVASDHRPVVVKLKLLP